MTVFVARCAAVGRDKLAVKNWCSDGGEWSGSFPEDGGIRFIRRVVTYIPVCTASRLSRVMLRTAIAFRGHLCVAGDRSRARAVLCESVWGCRFY